jgi:site-specific recombinase XerD
VTRKRGPLERELKVGSAIGYDNRLGQRIERRIPGQGICKVAKGRDTGGNFALHPHALRHACGAELLLRPKNLRVVQEQLRHVDIQKAIGYPTLTQQHLRKDPETLGNEWE